MAFRGSSREGRRARTSSDGARRRRETRRVVAEVTIHAPPFYNVSVSLFVSGRVKRKRLERSRRVERERKAARFALPTPTSSRGVGTPLAFFWPSARVFKQSAKSVNAPPKPKPKTDSNRIKPLFCQTRDSLGSAEALARARPRLHGSGSDGRARLRLSLPVRARFVRRRGSRTGALVPASPEFAKSDGWRISQRESWHPARLRDTLARDVLLSVHPR